MVRDRIRRLGNRGGQDSECSSCMTRMLWRLLRVTKRGQPGKDV